MRILNNEAAQAWCSKNNYIVIEGAPSIQPGADLIFALPSESSRISALSDFISNLILIDGEILLWVTDWAHYTPSQMYIYDSYRKSFGEHFSLIESATYLFHREDQLALSGHIFFMISFGWYAYILHSDSRENIYLGDTVIFIRSNSLTRQIAAKELVKFGCVRRR